MFSFSQNADWCCCLCPTLFYHEKTSSNASSTTHSLWLLSYQQAVYVMCAHMIIVIMAVSDKYKMFFPQLNINSLRHSLEFDQLKVSVSLHLSVCVTLIRCFDRFLVMTELLMLRENKYPAVNTGVKEDRLYCSLHPKGMVVLEEPALFLRSI